MNPDQTPEKESPRLTAEQEKRFEKLKKSGDFNYTSGLFENREEHVDFEAIKQWAASELALARREVADRAVEAVENLPFDAPDASSHSFDETKERTISALRQSIK